MLRKKIHFKLKKFNMNNCKIGIDLDGVIANFAYSFTELASHVYGMRVIEDENQILDWDWSKWYGLDKKD